MNDQEGTELAARLRGPEPEAQAAFDALFRESYEPLVRFTGAIVRDQAVAEELVQDVLLELWRRRERVELAGAPGAYLFRSARNRALNHLRNARVAARGAQVAAPDAGREATGPAELVGQEIDAAIREVYASLPPRAADVFRLSREAGMRYQEIAEHLGLSVKTVESHMARALRSFRERLAPWLPPGDRL